MKITVEAQGAMNTLEREINNARNKQSLVKEILGNPTSLKSFVSNLYMVIEEYKVHRAYYMTQHPEAQPNLYLDEFINRFYKLINESDDYSKITEEELMRFIRFCQPLSAGLNINQTHSLAWRTDEN